MVTNHSLSLLGYWNNSIYLIHWMSWIRDICHSHYSLVPRRSNTMAVLKLSVICYRRFSKCQWRMLTWWKKDSTFSKRKTKEMISYEDNMVDVSACSRWILIDGDADPNSLCLFIFSMDSTPITTVNRYTIGSGRPVSRHIAGGDEGGPDC